MSLLLANRALIKPSAGTNSFILSINTSLGDATAYFDLRDILVDGQTYDFTVYHNGTSTSYTGSTPSTEPSLDLAMPASSISQIEFEGKVGGWSVNNTASDRLKIISADQWGDVQFDYLEYAFYGASNITYIDATGLYLGSNKSLQRFVMNCTSLTTLITTDWNIDGVSSMYRFMTSSGLISIDLSNLNVGSCQTFYEFARNCNSLVTASFNNWTFSYVGVDVRLMLEDCDNLTTINADNWTFTSGIGAALGAFARDCNSLVNFDVSTWDTSGIDSVGGFVDNCPSLVVLDTSGWDTSEMTTCASMCSDCPSLTSSFDNTLWWDRAIAWTNYTDCFTNSINITNYFEIPFEWKGMVEVGTLTTDQSTLQQVGINRTYTGIAEINWGDGTYTRTTSAVEALHDYGSTGIYDIKLGAASNTAITNLYADSSQITTGIDLQTGLSIIEFQSNSLTALDLESVQINAILRVYVNPNLITLNLGTNNSNVYIFQANNTGISSLDLATANITIGISPTPNSYFDAFSCPNLQSIIFASSGNSEVDFFRVYSSDITGVLDIKDIVLSNWFYIYNNPNLTGILITSNGTTSRFYGYSCDLTGTIDVSALSISGEFRIQNNPNLTGLTFNASNGVLTIFYANLCNLPNLDFSVFSTSDGVVIFLQDNAMTSTEVDNQIINIDATGWINGTLNIAGTNAARTAVSDAAKTSLEAKGWTITVN